MSEEYRQYQYCEIRDPDYQQLRGKAFPIIRWELNSLDQVIGVQIEIMPGTIEWFTKQQIGLFKSRTEFMLIATQKYSRGMFSRITHNIRRLFS